MTRLYLRWTVVLIGGVVLAGLAAQRYATDVRPLTPEQLRQSRPPDRVRVIGMVQPGSLAIEAGGKSDGTDVAEMVASFNLAGELPGELAGEPTGLNDRLPVRYLGPADDNLRELKTIVIIGQLDGKSWQFVADRIDLIPNFGFISAAYLLGLIPLALFLFSMERRVTLLYTVIKETTLYKPEEAEQ
jgi:cytochrome c-type biogenesis protein CcmE